MSKDGLGQSLQEDLLTLFVFDPEAAKVIRQVVDPSLFEGEVYRSIVKEAVAFYDQFGTPPSQHMPDLMEPVLKGSNKARAELTEQILLSMYEMKEAVNRDFVLSRLEQFVRRQTLVKTVIEAGQLVQEGLLDEGESAILGYKRGGIETFSPGLAIKDITSALTIEAPNTIHLGMAPFDNRDIAPAPGELLILMGLPNSGKSWFLIHVVRMALLQRKRALHITLEMSEKKCARRYLQNFLSLTKRPMDVRYAIFDVDELGAFVNFKMGSVDRPAITDRGISKIIKAKAARFANLDLIIKQFPTGALSINGLRNYLDLLYEYQGFSPDLIVVDYPDLMEMDYRYMRTETQRINRELRGIAVERNLAMVAVSQANRSAEDAKVLTMKHFAEDYSKAGIADNVITYTQSELEHRLGLARLFSAKARDDEKGFTVLISQAYSMGQFVVPNQIAMMDDSYWRVLEGEG